MLITAVVVFGNKGQVHPQGRNCHGKFQDQGLFGQTNSVYCGRPRHHTVQQPPEMQDTCIMTQNRKDCFGVLDNVFPMGDEGLREIVPECFQCPDRKECLQTALQTKEGFQLRTEALDRSSSGGLMGRLKRWSEKKTLSKRRKEQKSEC